MKRDVANAACMIEALLTSFVLVIRMTDLFYLFERGLLENVVYSVVNLVHDDVPTQLLIKHSLS